MSVLNRHMVVQIGLTTFVITLILAAILFLTQSLKFIELIISAGASSSTFWVLTALALPRFMEVILPIALMSAALFHYNKMMMDNEIIVMRAAGISPLELARPGLVVAGICFLVMTFVMAWAGPKSLSNMHQLRQIVKAQYSTLIFQEGVFNPAGKGVTVYVREKKGNELHGLLIHDTRPENPQPVTVTARRGQVVTDDAGNQRVVVYNGSRQQQDSSSKILARLNFDEYTIDLPRDNGPVRIRWKQPDERTLVELLKPDLENDRDLESLKAFQLELHRRVATPFLCFSFAVIAMSCLILGAFNRRGQIMRVVAAVGYVVVLQGLFLAAFNLAGNYMILVIFVYLLAIFPAIAGLFLLSTRGEVWRQKLFFKVRMINQ